MQQWIKQSILALAVVIVVCSGVRSAHAVPTALTPFTVIDVSSGAGVASGAVGTGHEIFSFDAFAGDLVTLDIDVTAILPGTTFTDDDSELFLFDSIGLLLASNDDFGGSLQSAIVDFLIPSDATYFVGVTTFDNNPFLSGGIITGWEDNGESNIKYDLIVSGVSPVPEPGTWALMGTGLIGLLGYGWRKRHQQNS